MAIVECVPNFSEGRDQEIIRRIRDAIDSVNGVSVLHTDIGISANRTVITFVGEPEAVVQAAFLGIREASKLIDMSCHHGEHPRLGAADVVPLIPIAGISMRQVVELSRQLSKRVGEELGIPVYLYEESASIPHRRSLEYIRKGQYEGLSLKLQEKAGQPDFGPLTLNVRCGATVIGARNLLLAYNVNLDTDSLAIAKSIAAEVRSSGKLNRVDGKVQYDEEGNPLRTKGLLSHVKAMGWYMEQFGIAQVSMNLTNLNRTPVHIAYETVKRCAGKKGVRVTGSELIGLIPQKVILEAGRYFFLKKGKSALRTEKELIKEAVISLGLADLKPFDPDERILERAMDKAINKS